MYCFQKIKTHLISVYCNSNKESTRETEIINCALFLVIQLKRFAVVNGQLIKDEQQISCFPFLQKDFRVPISTNDVVTLYNECDLVARNSHSGSLYKDHYQAIAKGKTKTYLQQ